MSRPALAPAGPAACSARGHCLEVAACGRKSIGAGRPSRAPPFLRASTPHDRRGPPIVRARPGPRSGR
jgi:hypothetical protein